MSWWVPSVLSELWMESWWEHDWLSWCLSLKGRCKVDLGAGASITLGLVYPSIVSGDQVYVGAEILANAHRFVFESYNSITFHVMP